MLLSIFGESSRLQVVWSYSELTEEQENEKVGNSRNLLNNLHSFDLSRRNILMERKFSFITNKRCKAVLCDQNLPQSVRWFVGKFISYNAYTKRYENLVFIIYKKKKNKNFHLSILSRFYTWYLV